MDFIDSIRNNPLGKKTGATVTAGSAVAVAITIGIEPRERQVLVDQGIAIVVHPVALFNVRIVADTITVDVRPFGRVEGKGVIDIVYSIIVIIVIAGITGTVVIGIDLLWIGHGRAVVRIVRQPVAILVVACTRVNVHEVFRFDEEIFTGHTVPVRPVLGKPIKVVVRRQEVEG